MNFDESLKNLEIGGVFSFMLITGEEVISQVTAIEGDVIKLQKPRKVVTHMEIDPNDGSQSMRMGLMSMFNTDNEETFPVTIRQSMIGAVQIPAKGAADGYSAQTSLISLDS